MKNLTFISLFLSLILFIVSCDKNDNDDKTEFHQVFSSTVGTKWTYLRSDNHETFFEEVLRKEFIGNQECTVIGRYSHLSDTIETYYSQKDNQIYEYARELPIQFCSDNAIGEGDTLIFYSEPTLAYIFHADSGFTWNQTIMINNCEEDFNIMQYQGDTSITTDAGLFDCAVITSEEYTTAFVSSNGLIKYTWLEYDENAYENVEYEIVLVSIE